MITNLIIFVFIMGYLGIALEHPAKIDKTAPALLTGMLCWALFAMFGADVETLGEDALHYIKDGHWMHYVEHELAHHLFEISNILFFLLGAMTIVEVIDSHDGFHIITSKINTTNKVKLMWIVAILTFFLSALLDNLTTTIVMVSLMKKLLEDKKLRLVYAGIIVISANAGGAWSPIGDITTTMLWIGGQISVLKIIIWVILPSIVCMLVPVILMTFKKDMQGEFKANEVTTTFKTTAFERGFVFCLAIGCLVFVPVFKTITHLPPFMGMLFGLGLLWTVTEILHKAKDYEEKSKLSVIHALTKIDTPSVLFFLGILTAVSCLQSMGVLRELAGFLADKIGNYDIIVIVIGVLSAIVDNVPLVAASMGMYDVDPTSTQFMTDGKFWQFLAYCAGTGGSMLIIGSAAGVAAMGIEKIDFIWYFKKFAWLAFTGYIAGAMVYLLQYKLFA